MVEEAKGDGPPQPILIKQSTIIGPAVNEDGLPPPVKAASTPSSPVSGLRVRRHSLLLRSGLIALFFAPFGFLMYAFVPDFDSSTMTISILVLMLIGVIFVAVGASKGQPQPRPRPRNLTVHPVKDTVGIYDLEALEQNAAGELNNSGPVQTTTKPGPTSQPDTTTSIKVDSFPMWKVLAGLVVILPLTVIVLGSEPLVAPLVAVYCACCFLPEIFLYGIVPSSAKRRGSDKEGGQGGELSPILVVLLIALFCLIIIAAS